MTDFIINEELLDIVDNNDNIIGKMTYDEFYKNGKQDGHLIRGSIAFIRNKDGKLWVPRRLETKRLKPNALDFSVAEHVSSGEEYIDAVIRGFKEELNMKVSADDLILIGKIAPTGVMRFFTQGFILNYNEAPDYNTDDFYEYYWFSPSELEDMIVKGELAKDAIVPMLKLLQ